MFAKVLGLLGYDRPSGLVFPLILVLLLCTTQLMVLRAWYYIFPHNAKTPPTGLAQRVAHLRGAARTEFDSRRVLVESTPDLEPVGGRETSRSNYLLPCIFAG